MTDATGTSTNVYDQFGELTSAENGASLSEVRLRCLKPDACRLRLSSRQATAPASGSAAGIASAVVAGARNSVRQQPAAHRSS